MGKDKPELPSRNDGGEPSWFKMTGWYNLRSTILLVESLIVLLGTTFCLFIWEFAYLKPYAQDSLLGLTFVVFWLLHWLLLGRFISKWIALAAFALAFAAGCYLNNSFGGHVEGWSREAKQNLHAIQLALERYASDHEGHYPPFLIGGELTFDSIDPLLRKSDWKVYPTCAADHGYPPSRTVYALIRRMAPWVIEPDSYYSIPSDVKWLQAEYKDAYSADSSTARFGKDYTLMGNVAADHRFPQASFGYPFWERKASNTDKLSIALQGQLYYKALYSPGATKPDAYVLMAFEPAGFEGQDLFTSVPGGHELDGRLPDGSGLGMGVPVIPSLGLKGDGIPDGVMIVLSGGWVAKEFD
jgi:hypothetical protein